MAKGDQETRTGGAKGCAKKAKGDPEDGIGRAGVGKAAQDARTVRLHDSVLSSQTAGAMKMKDSQGQGRNGKPRLEKRRYITRL